MRQLGVNIIKLMIPKDLGFMCFWTGYSSLLPPGGGFGICKITQRTRLGILSTALEEELKVLDSD